MVQDAVPEIGHARGRSFDKRTLGDLDLIVHQNPGPRVLSDLEEGNCLVKVGCVAAGL